MFFEGSKTRSAKLTIARRGARYHRRAGVWAESTEEGKILFHRFLRLVERIAVAKTLAESCRG